MINGLPSVAIVGGGIGGLTCALALADVGIESIVLERYKGGPDVGAGIQLSPNATRVFYRLGFESDLAAIGRTPTAMVWLDGETDRQLARLPIRDYVNAEFDTPYLQFYRPELMDVLESRCSDNALIDLRKSTLVQDLRLSEDEVILKTSNGEVHSDLCIGADGTNSTIRKFTNNSQNQRINAGYAYRTVIPLSQLDEHYASDETTLWLNSAFHVVTYVVGEDSFLNCVFVVESSDSDRFEDFHRQKSSLHSLTATIANPSPLLDTLIKQVPDETLYRWPLYQFPPIPVRLEPHHRVVLIGDAWHTTFPFAGQGAALAIEDAAALATCISNRSERSLDDRISRYENARISRIQRVQTISARNRTVYHIKNPILKLFRSWVARFAYRSTSQLLFRYEGIAHN
ncbi:MAG: FAD-dependent monooxygenase [Gammaproteobacteria bacterium]|nr:FAD-dependent monooxygenase [Gammaproteobacteria bacterium]